MKRVWLAGLLGAALFAVLWVNNCSGPEPKVLSHRVESPETPGDPYRVDALVRNEGPGHGQAQVIFRLRSRATGEIYATEENVQLQRGETSHVIGEIHAPPADYDTDVEAEYPPR